MDKYKPMAWYIGNEWKMPRKGLRKQVLALDDNFNQLDKPHLVAKVAIVVEEVHHLNGRESRYLASDIIGQEQQLEMGTALTPVDCYVELLVRQMIAGERAQCYIATNRKQMPVHPQMSEQPQMPEQTPQQEVAEISFIIKLCAIHETKEIHKLSVTEMYALALRYKENGVKMFKTYPLFAHDYFARAAKCLISYKPFENLTAQADGVSGDDMAALFIQIQTNLAACLLNEQRYEDVIYLTQFVEDEQQQQQPATVVGPSEKSIYRRALAFYHLQEFEKSRQLIERVENWQEKKEFAKLHQRLADSWKTSNAQYKTFVQRMFSS